MYLKIEIAKFRKEEEAFAKREWRAIV